MRPDTSTPEGRAAYRRELRRVARRWRLAGLAMAAIGAVGAARFGRGPEGLNHSSAVASLLLAAAGWALLIVAIAKRTRYHLARMAEPPA